MLVEEGGVQPEARVLGAKRAPLFRYAPLAQDQGLPTFRRAARQIAAHSLKKAIASMESLPGRAGLRFGLLPSAH